MPPLTPKTEKKRLLEGVLVLMPATLFTKLVGLLYKIPLIAIVGVTGMAYFLAAYHVYSALFVLLATGLPTALSLTVAGAVARGEEGGTRRMLLAALCLFLPLGGIGTAFLCLFAAPIAARLSMASATACILAVAPSLLLSAFIGGVKGYFQGHHRMLPTAVSEALEAAGKLGFGLCFALLAVRRGADAPTVAAYAIFGITAGLTLAALVLGVWLIADLLGRPATGGKPLPSVGGTLKGLCRLALPITVSASVMSLVSLMDTALISGQLQRAGFAPDVANAMYSSYGNLAVPLYNLVPTLLTPVTLALMPLLAAGLSGGDKEGGRQALSAALRLCTLVAIPAALGLGVFAEPILRLIYTGQGEAVRLAAPLLSLLAAAVLPAALITLTGAALQATGHTVLPIAATLAGAAVKLGVELLLLPVRGVYIFAAPISTLACNLTVLAVEGMALSRVLPFRFFSGKALFRPLGAAVLGIGAGSGVYLLLSRRWDSPLVMLPVLGVCALLFALLALRLRAVGEEELSALPYGDRLCGALRKMKLLR